MNRLFVVRKPIFRSSNSFLGAVKRKYRTKKAGFSGTLDPFATGCLIVASGQYTKLFQYLDKIPKSYCATLWLGTSSPTLDIEKVESISQIAPLDIDQIADVLESFHGTLHYLPPQYSAKNIDGKRAYKLAREGKEPQLGTITSTIFKIQLLHYNHPFIHFEAVVSEGTYIRSLGSLISEKLGTTGVLSSLERTYEGSFCFDSEKMLDPLDHLCIPQNFYLGDESDVDLGKKLSIDQFHIKQEGLYFLVTAHFFAIIEIKDGVISYRLNRVEKFSNTIHD